LAQEPATSDDTSRCAGGRLLEVTRHVEKHLFISQASNTALITPPTTPTSTNIKLQTPPKEETDTNGTTKSTSPDLVPLPCPNNLTTTYTPFTHHLALLNRLSPCLLSSLSLLTNNTPIFLHSTLQLPSFLSTLLSLPLPEFLSSLTPAVALKHTTTVCAATLLPSLVPAGALATYTYTNGMVFFPASARDNEEFMEMIGEWYQATRTRQSSIEIRKIRVQIEDAEGERWNIDALAWVTEDGHDEGAENEEWWTVEEFVAGRVVGLGTVKW
jgi:hypothetical protein